MRLEDGSGGYQQRRQHASRLCYGLDRSSCEGTARQCWILAENEGPSCLSTGCERKKAYRATTSTVVQVLFRWDVFEVDPPNHIPNSPEGEDLDDYNLIFALVI